MSASVDTAGSMSVRRILVLAAIVSAIFALAACGATGTSPGVRRVSAEEAVRALDGRTIIDVRTPAELADGMLADAVNISLEAPDFRARISELERDGSYMLYCRSGNRSAQAADMMRDLGFTDVIDGGGMDGLVAAGAATEP